MPDLKLFVLIALISFALCATVCTGCGSTTAHISTLETRPIETDPSTIELPAGVNTETWAQVSRAFNKAMAESSDSSGHSGLATRINDLELEIEPGNVVKIGWSYRNDGDYNFDGETNLADLVEIVIHFGSRNTDETWMDAVHADGDGNGEVGLSDVSVIAKNFSTIVHAYVIQATRVPGVEQSWIDLAQTSALPAHNLDDGGRPIYAKALFDLENGSYLRVVPQISIAGSPEVILGPPSDTKLYGLGEWLTARHDASGTGRSAFIGPAELGIKWVVDGIDARDVEMFIPADGSVRLIPFSEYSYWDQEMLVVSTDGETNLTTPPTENFMIPQNMFGNGSYLSWDQNFNIVLQDTALTFQWSFTPPDGKPALYLFVGNGNDIYYGSNGREIGRLNLAGEIIWTYTASSYIRSMAVATDGSTRFTSGYDLHAVDSEGTLLWTQDYLNGEVVAIDQNNTTYLSTQWGPIEAVSGEGNLLWTLDLETTISDELTLGPEGNIYVTTEYGYQLAPENQDDIDEREENKLYAISPEGSLLWEFSPQRQISNAIVDAAGTVYLATRGALFAINPDGTEAWHYTTDMDVLQTAIGPDGTLYAYLRTQLEQHGPAPPPGPGPGPGDAQAQDMTVNGQLIEGELIAFGPGNIQLPPDAPTGLVASKGEFEPYIMLNWNLVPDVDYYEIFRDTRDNLVLTGAHGTAWVDRDISDWNTHEYWIRAVGPSGVSALSLSDVGSITRGFGSVGRGDWYMEGRDPQRSYQSGVVGPVSGELDWSVNLNTPYDPFAYGSQSASTPVFGFDGTIFVAGSKQYALWPDGSLKWTFEPPTYMTNYIGKTAAIDITGTIFIGGSLEHRVSAIGTAVGALAQDDQGVFPLLNQDGSVVFSARYSYEKGVVKLGSDGSEIWNFYDGLIGEYEQISTLVVKSPGGNYLFGTNEGYIYAIDESGGLLWVYDPTEAHRESGMSENIYSVTCGSDDSIVVVSTYYFPNGEGSFQPTTAMLKYNHDGILLWALDLAPWGSHYDSGPATGSSGNIYIASDPAQMSISSQVLKIRHDGIVLFQFDTHGKVSAPVILDADENVFICANQVETWPSGEEETVVFALDNSGAQLWSNIVEGTVLHSPSIGNDGTLYVSTEAGSVYAFRDQ